MRSRQRKGAREAAYEILTAIEERAAFAEAALDRYLELGKCTDVRDRALATELVYGILRRRGVLDQVLQQYSTKALDQLDKDILRILRLGAYQILFLDKIPDHAAVDESVKLAKRFSAPGAPLFVNAVLRAVCREKTRESIQALVSRAGFGGPVWLASLWEKELGTERAARCLEHIQRRPATILRINTLKISPTQFIEQMQARAIEVDPLPDMPEAVRIGREGDVRTGMLEDLFAAGLFVQQDTASQLITWILDPQPGERILDCCAAPGIKTTHIGQYMRNFGRIVAVDRNPVRLAELAQLCQKMGVASVQPICGNAANEIGLPIKESVLFDRILVDVPCSGLGILQRAPERKWRSIPAFCKLATLQYRILACAARHLRRGGVLVYSTCTVVNEENDAVVERFLSEHEEFLMEHPARFLPGSFRDLVDEAGYFRSWLELGPWDFFFAARLRRL